MPCKNAGHWPRPLPSGPGLVVKQSVGGGWVGRDKGYTLLPLWREGGMGWGGGRGTVHSVRLSLLSSQYRFSIKQWLPPFPSAGRARQPSHKTIPRRDAYSTIIATSGRCEQLDVPAFRIAISSPDVANPILTLLIPGVSHSQKKGVNFDGVCSVLGVKGREKKETKRRKPPDLKIPYR